MSGKILKCSSCGAVIEEITACECPCGYECCGEKMTAETANTVDASKEKHVPVPESLGGKMKVSVGSAPHPMTKEHHILWIEVIDGRRITRYHPALGEMPEAVFDFPLKSGMIVRSYCNLHGLWKTVIA